jgi:translation initiation factor 5A
MSDHDDETFENVDAGASLTYPVPAGNLKKGHHVCIKNFPCKIIEITTSKTGKHGHAKANITAVDIFTGKKLEEVCPSSHSLPCPVVKTLTYDLVDIAEKEDMNGKFVVSLMDDEGETREDLNLPEDADLVSKLRAGFEKGDQVQVQVTAAMDHECIMGLKSSISE